ncbi:MAG: ATP-binding protein [Burkholderiaceae bacterium]
MSEARAVPLELNRAQVQTEVDGWVSTKETRLPYNWDWENRFHSGRASFELHFTLESRVVAPHALYFASVGNVAEIWLNDVFLSQLGDEASAHAVDFGKTPIMVLVPAHVLQQKNLLRVHLGAEGGRRAGMSTVLLGTEIEIRQLFSSGYRHKVWSAMGIALFTAVVGLLAFVLWLGNKVYLVGERRGRKGMYLSVSAASLFWLVRLSDVALVTPPVSWPWWGVVQTLAYAGWICGVALFCHYKAAWHRHPSMAWIQLVLGFLLLSAGPAAYIALTRSEPIYLTLWLGLANLLFIGYGLVYFMGAIWYPNHERTVLALAGVSNVAVGVRDWLVFRASDSFGQSPWINYSSTLFGLAFLYIMVRHLLESSARVQELMTNLESKLSQQEAELADSYRKLEDLARSQERQAERSRILRDMHDGVGVHLSMAIHQLQSGKGDKIQLLQTLRDSMDQLKLSIDSLSVIPGDIVVMLATLRYRLESRFKDSHIHLTWNVEPLPPLAKLDASAMRQLQYLVFEALSNVLQHAHASELSIKLHLNAAGAYVLSIVDNGGGFEVSHQTGHGLNSIKQRADLLGARLAFVSQPGRTELSLEFSQAAA